MTISFSLPPFNVPAVEGFDDPWQRRQQHVQHTLRQLAPRTIDGGRKILWRCSHCHEAWYEADTSSAVLHLSHEQFSAYAFQLGIQDDLEELPASLCPECSCRLLGGILRIEEQLSGGGYRFTWRSAATSEVWVYQMMLPNEGTISQILSTEDFEPLFSTLLCRPVDLLLPTPTLRHLLEQLIRLPEPAWDDLVPFSAHHLHLQANQIPKLPTGYLRGYFWLPTRRVPALNDVLLIAVSSVTPDLSGSTPHQLLEGWNMVFSHLSLYLSYQEKKEQ